MIGWIFVALTATVEPSQGPCVAVEACRQVDNVRVENALGEKMLMRVNQMLPWVVEENLLLVPGDWDIVKLVDRDGALIPQLVNAGNSGEPPEPVSSEIRVIVHHFKERALTMEVLSRRTETLDYAALVVVGSNSAQFTSVCSLEPGITVFESWQWPIRQIALRSFRSTSKPGCKTLDLSKDAVRR